MKKVIYVGCIALIVVAAWIGAKKFPNPALAQPASGQVYYPYHTLNSADATTAVAVWTTDTDERFAIHAIVINVGTTMSVQLLDEATIINTYYFSANDFVDPILNLRSAAKGNDLKVKASTAGQISVLVTGEQLWW